MNNISELISELNSYIVDPTQGLPEDVFLFASSITPLVNVDLLVRDYSGRVLLAWRNDKWYGSGWHVPGGIIRVKETFDERIQKCALSELHSNVMYKKEPLEMFTIIEENFSERCHFFSFVYDCKMPRDYVIDNTGLTEIDTGYLKWHDKFPENMVRCHEIYRKYFRNG